jgi:branched-chain amino acid transport system permease protein
MAAGTDLPSPPDARARLRRRAAGWMGLAAIVVLAAAVALPAVVGRSVLQDLFFIATMLALAESWNLLAGYAGLVSIGQQAFVGLGAYTLFAATLSGLDPLAAVVAGGLVAALLALPTALVVFRLRGAYFAVGTWVAAEVYRLLLAQAKWLGGGTGTSLDPDVANGIAGLDLIRHLFGVRGAAARDIAMYWAALVLLVATLVAAWLLLRSRRGLALAAIRDAEPTAEGVGVDAFRTKLFVYVLTALATGMVGALIYLQKARVSPDAAFSVLDWTAYVIFIVVIGGIGTLEGPIIGAVVLYLLQTWLAALGTWYLIILGGLAALVMLVAPKGLWGFVAERFDVQIFPLRRRFRADQPAGLGGHAILAGTNGGEMDSKSLPR